MSNKARIVLGNAGLTFYDGLQISRKCPAGTVRFCRVMKGEKSHLESETTVMAARVIKVKRLRD